jgi:signal transduction histidine kinase
MRSRRSLTVRLVIPIAVIGLLATVAGLVAAAVRAEVRVGQEAEQRAGDQIIALETVANVSDLAGLRRAATTTGAVRGVELVVVAAGDPLKVIASSSTELIGMPVSSLSNEVLPVVESLQSSLAASAFHAARDGDELIAAGRLHVREVGRDGADLSNAVAVVALDLSLLARQVAADTFVLSIGGVLAIAALSIIVILLIRRHVLRPLKRIAANVSMEGNGGSTSVESYTSNELRGLATTLQEALAERAESEARLAEANQHLATSNLKLEGMVESKDQLVAAVSHELRTPLTAILGLAEFLKDREFEFSDEDRASMVETIYNEGKDVANLIEDLMTAARADIGQLDINPVGVDLLAQARQVAEGLAGRVPGVQVAGEQTCVIADASRVRQIIRNLLTNARRYGGPVVVVEVARVGDHGLLRVIDDGEGISRDDRQRIFEPYESAHDATVPDSVGIGLSLSRSLARLMSGDLIYDRVGDESIFELSLPATPRPSDVEVEESAAEALPAS